ncbi:MAG TPA: alpha/beta hydrolase [Terracidiphilus sp.]|jgi:pimeloyl-ACP methyl ester carboxylesterase|nr:alpha/beta hydrolase [Terracidiphilus sp.]
MGIAVWFVLFITVLVAAGMLYQALGSRRDVRLYAGAGRWIAIGGRSRLYVLEAGSGEPTVLFEAGIGATNLNWRHVQQSVAQFTGTASYDRTGLGWSSPCRTARTPGNIAAELHEMLERAGIKPPYILVGHSFGGLVMRRYALDYPQDVAGMVLVDPMRCEEWPPLDGAKQGELERGRKLIRFASPIARCGLARLAVASLFNRAGKLPDQIAGVGGSGGRHVLGRLKTEVGKMPREVWPVVAAHWSRPGFYAGMRKHIESIPDTVREMHAAEPILEIPVIVLTPGKSKPLSEECLRRIGNRTRQVIAPASAHWIHLDEPELVIDSIRNLVEAVTPVAPALQTSLSAD